MKSTHKSLAGLVAVLAVVLIAGAAAALTIKTVSVPAGGDRVQNLGNYDSGDILTFSWSCTNAVPVSGTLTGPNGFSESYQATIAGGNTILVSDSGEYILTLHNAEATSSSVQLTYTSPGTEIGNILTTIVIIAVIIIVVIIIIVVVVFMAGRKKKQVAMPPGAPAGIVTPTTPGVCPVCGSQTDTNAQFCAKCGARFH